MIGILLLSHGEMAKGMLNSAGLFFGELQQVEAVCLMGEDSPEEFDERVKAAAARVDDGHGVMVFCDLFGGTPSNRCAFMLNDRMQVIPGMNFTMLLEFLGTRLMTQDISEVDVETLIETGRNGIVSLNAMLKAAMGQ